MSRWKARLCTILLLIVIIIVLTASYFVKSYYGFTLYQLIIEAIAYLWIGDHIVKFYQYLIKQS